MKKQPQKKKSIFEEIDESENLSKTIKQKVVNKLVKFVQKKFALFIIVSLVINLIPALIYYAYNNLFWFLIPFLIVGSISLKNKIQVLFLEKKFNKISKKEINLKERLKKMN